MQRTVANEQKIGDFFASFMNEDLIEELGITPILPMLDRIAAISSHEELTTTMASMRRDGLGGPFSMYVSTDAKNPEIYALHMSQSGLGLPDRDYYFRDSEDFEKHPY